MEQWKVIKEYKSDSRLHLRGDKIYVSDRGRVRLNGIVLDYTNGLYVSGGELHIYGCGFKYKNMHRTIYQLFKGDLKYGSNYNIHHINYNHLDNDVNNLMLCTAKEHGDIHSNDQVGNIGLDKLRHYNNIIKQLEDNKEECIKSAIVFLSNRVNKYRIEQQIKKEQQKEQSRINKQEKLIKEREDKLKSGKYGVSRTGRLYLLDNVNLKQSRIGFKTSEETKQKISQSVKQRYKDDKEYYNKIKKILVQNNANRWEDR